MKSLAEVEVVAKAEQYKLKVLREADHCKHREVGAPSRRVGLYWWDLTSWCKQPERGELGAKGEETRSRNARRKTR